MKMRAGHAGQILLELESQEVSILDNLVGQTMSLLQSHSTIALDPDPLFAGLEIGGSKVTPEDPALARLLPDAYSDSEESGGFRQLTEQSIVNRKIEDAIVVAASLGAESPENARKESREPVNVVINASSFQPWLRTLTAVRLAMSSRLGITSQSDVSRLSSAPDSQAALFVFEWLGGVLEALLQLQGSINEDDTRGDAPL